MANKFKSVKQQLLEKQAAQTVETVKVDVENTSGAIMEVPFKPGEGVSASASVKVSAPNPDVATARELEVEAEVQKRVAAALAAAPKASSNDPLEEKVAAAVARGMATVAPILAKSMGEALGTSLMAAEAVKEQTGHNKRLEELRKKNSKEEKCYLCRQVVGDGRLNGCGGPYSRNKNGTYLMEKMLNPDGTEVMGPDDKPVMRRVENFDQFHTKMVVFPREPMALQCWDGITINGATYMSAGPGSSVWVPKNGVDEIMSRLSAYEQGERDARIPKKRSRNGGTVNGRTGGHTGPGVGDGWNTAVVQ